jgi:hypothetical protein
MKNIFLNIKNRAASQHFVNSITHRSCGISLRVLMFIGLIFSGFLFPIETKAGVGDKFGEYTITHVLPTGNQVINTSGRVYEVTGGSGTITVETDTASVVLVLNGTTRTQALSGLQVRDRATLTVYLVEGKTNTFTCNGTSNTSWAVQAGIYVAPDATLIIKGPGSLIANGGRYSAGIGGIYTNGGVRSGTIIIDGGTVTANGGADGAAGIGGGRHNPGGTTKIRGGIVNANGSTSTSIGNVGGAGIGGGGGGNNDSSPGGWIYISGGVVTARSFNSSAAIGGGLNSIGELIEITGGTIDARSSTGGTGIGAGGGRQCGTINISGGNIFAKGSQQAAGIGCGVSVSGGTINISGGIIHAESADNGTSGVGGGGNGNTTINITSGSVFSVIPNGNIRINKDPKNSAAYGNRLVYLVGLKLVNENNVILPGREVSIQVKHPSNTAYDYIYYATTNNNGIAYLWLPNGQSNYLLYNAETGTYVDDVITVVIPADPSQYNPNTSVAQICLYGNKPDWSLSANSNKITLDINHNNPGTCSSKAIAGVLWFRESVTAPVNTRETFNAGYAFADLDDKGTGGAGNVLNLVNAANQNEQQYILNANKKGRYWFQIHYITANSCTDLFHVSYVDIDTILPPDIVEIEVCEGSKVTFTATPTNEGNSPIYQWKKNGVDIAGANSQTYSYYPVSNDTISCALTSSEDCADPESVISDIIAVKIVPPNTISLISAIGADDQTCCINTAINNIIYFTTGATGATVTGLPDGVTGNWVNNVVTIIGTPIESGIFNYTVNLSGGCPITKIGKITVNEPSTGSLITANNDTICSGDATTLIASAPGITNPIFRWYADANTTSILHIGNSLSTGTVTETTIFYVSVEGDNYCEGTSNATGRKAVTVTVDQAVKPGVNIMITVD